MAKSVKDKCGHPVSVGCRVSLEGVVKSIDDADSDEHCNLTVEVADPHHPEHAAQVSISSDHVECLDHAE